MKERINHQSNPHNINSELSRIQKKIPLEATAATVLTALTLPLIVLAMSTPNFETANTLRAFAMTLAWNLSMGTLALASVAGGVKLAGNTASHIQERGKLITKAKEKGLKASGIIFKRVR